MDELKDLVPDAEFSLPAFNVVTGSYDPGSLKSTLLEIKTMWYGVKYTSVPRATAVDRFERSLLGDIQRGLPSRDAAWHNTEPGQKTGGEADGRRSSGVRRRTNDGVRRPGPVPAAGSSALRAMPAP
eukprot:jgi/Tetstr1/449925/TSEL_036979.t1